MEPVSIALICAAAFGGVVALSVFIRQLLISRDKSLNDLAQQKALSQEADELARIREEMKESKSRYTTHYQILDSNKDGIQYMDEKIHELLEKKADLIQRFSELMLKESDAIIKGEQTAAQKRKCDRLQQEMDAEISFYDDEIAYYQKRRDSLWGSHREFLDHLLAEEKNRNDNLDKLYDKHSALLQKVFLRHNENAQSIAKETLAAGTISFKDMIMAPILFLMQYFGLAKGISLDQLNSELDARSDVSDAESEINGDYDDEYLDDYDTEDSESDEYESDAAEYDDYESLDSTSTATSDVQVEEGRSNADFPADGYRKPRSKVVVMN